MRIGSIGLDCAGIDMCEVDEVCEAGALRRSIADEPQIVTYSNSAAITNSCASAYHSILSTFGLQQIWQSST